MERTHDAQERCLRSRLAILVIATSWLTGFATAGFEANGVAACSPVVDYSKEIQARAAEELAMLPDGSAVVEMVSDFAVMRDQARFCGVAATFTVPRWTPVVHPRAIPADRLRGAAH